ncbi:hypothetical protein FHT00_000350 [Sphingomonas insulae]|uniref:Lipoprotein n=1 Tax=Sphingomonas insulae TaxID=424800 RepID=A0ABN1HUY3_9SPHN|nr:hypothetical protein [Sphingomonas insulae]NIJ28422.1 hypothetical protein [Sphingomonas insulae]
MPLAAGLLPLLAGCASFAGTPEPVIATDQVVAIAREAPYRIQDAAALIAASGNTTLGYRNAFIAVQLAAIDARYLQFRRKLAIQSKSANFGLEIGTLALTGGGAVAGERLANILSAGGAGLTGTKAALSKEVYFEKALPALIASMEAQRLAARAPLIAGLRQTIIAYPTAQAIADLFALQNSASLDAAIGSLTAAATQQQGEAEARYTQVVATCAQPEDGVDADWRRLRQGLRTLDAAADEATLDIVSGLIGSDTAPPYAEQKRLVVAKVASAYCTRVAVQDLMRRITASAGVPFP